MEEQEPIYLVESGAPSEGPSPALGGEISNAHTNGRHRAPAGAKRPGTAVEIDGLTLRAGDQVLLDNASARFEPGRVTLIVGRSGVGKSLLLRVLAGLADTAGWEVSASGQIRLLEEDPRNPDGPSADTSRERRDGRVGVVFQNFALFDELSPADNVRLAYAHRRRGPQEPADPAPENLLEELRVPRRVRTASLSGGQRQRLAIARTLAYRPEVILYDEPTSGLDTVTAAHVARLIEATHEQHPQTSIVVTHDYESLSAIADAIYLLDAETKKLRRIEREDWPQLHQLLQPTAHQPAPHQPAAPASDERLPIEPASPLPHGPLLPDGPPPQAPFLRRLGDFFAGTSRAALAAVSLPLSLVPRWRSAPWGLRFFLHYLRLVADPSAWLYVALAGGIAGFVSTYFTFRFLPYRSYTEPLVIENLLSAMGFALYRVLVPVLIGILVAAVPGGAAVASDVGGKVYGQQLDALRSFGARPERYLLTGILHAFLLGTPLLTGIGFLAAKAASLLVFAWTHARPQAAEFWGSNFHRELVVPGSMWYEGSWWLLAKLLTCAAGIGLLAYYRGARPKHSSNDISRGITSTILWATLHVLVVNLAFAFFEFD